jgi:hypothetical protein
MAEINRLSRAFDRFFGNGPRIVTLRTKTYPRMLKKGRVSGLPCPVAGVHRIVSRNGIIGSSYENGVNNRRALEGQPVDANDVVLYFDALELWNGKGEHVGRWFVRHIDKPGSVYLTFRPKQKPGGEVVVMDDVWMDDAGNIVNPDDLEEWLPLPSVNRRQMVDRLVPWRTIELDNVLSVTFDGQELPLAA